MDDLGTKQLKGIRNILIILLVIVTFIILKELSSLLLPLALAGLLTILDLPLVGFLERRRVPRVLITLIVSIVTIAIIWIIFSMIGGTIDQLMNDSSVLASQFMKKVDLAITWIGATIPGLDSDQIREEVNQVLTPAGIAGLIGSVFGALGNVGSGSLFFLIYYLILLSGATGYHSYLEYVLGDRDSKSGSRDLWDQTEKTISTYMGIKTLISLATGIMAGLICAAFGLEFALFWGFLGFIMNFIPSIGSIVATGLPVFMAIIQFDQFGLILALGILLGASQFLIGSVIDPMIMGNRLSLNTVTVIFGLVFWGYIWGIPGMLLSVPLMVVIRLLLLRSDELSIVARIMGVAEKPGRKKPALVTRLTSAGGRIRDKAVSRKKTGKSETADSDKPAEPVS